MFDAASCLAMGALLAGAAGALAPLFGIDQGLVRGAGLALLPAGAFILWLATRETVPALLVYLLIAANLLWVAESVSLIGMTSGITAVGAAFVGIQAAAVAGLSLLEWIGIRRSSAVAA
jgi:hypothetical protein